MAPDPDKAANYIRQLDEARCDGNWDAVPELVRKVRKHAPDRACLALTAQTEHAIAKATPDHLASARPSTAVTAKDLDVFSQIPKLLAVVEQETRYVQDRLQAQVCVGWLHWVVGEYNLAFIRLPKELGQEDASEGGEPPKLSEWTRVCALKSVFLRANCLMRNEKREDKTAEALAIYQEGLSWPQQKARKQLTYWSELFLTEYCMLLSRALEEDDAILEQVNCLASFRSWAMFWEAAKGSPLSGGHGFRDSVPRRRVWFEYYAALSVILRNDLPYPTGYVPTINNEASARAQLRVELKKIEAAYEALLLNETAFPRADEQRLEVEAFVRLVLQNWAVLSGRGWREQDLGQGGRESLSRGVLDILYRASMKTFHSTAILRSLFTVHLAVAEFDLAFKAFDSYLEIVKKGRARVDKTGDVEPSLDDDAAVMETISSAIAALCRYGDRQAAEKARDLGKEMEHWLGRISQPMQTQSNTTNPLQQGVQTTPRRSTVPPRVQALAWQSIGLAEAEWSRVTYDSAARTEIQSKAIDCLRKSLSAEFGASADLKSIFALGVLLAEHRQLATAIELVKTALLSTPGAVDGRREPQSGPFWRERSLIPLWHLLALLLSARQEHVMAARACEGAFEQFKDPAVLFGGETMYRSDHLNEAEGRKEKNSDAGKGVVDEMDDFEKESILEVKMTQLALIEVNEGPRVAVNASLELLSLFSRLFGSLQPKAAALNPPKTSEVPKSSAGTLRSIKGSIFGGRSGRMVRQFSTTNSEKLATIPSRPQTTQTAATIALAAPTIQVTGENGGIGETRRSRTSAGHPKRSESSRRTGSLRKMDSASNRRPVSSGGLPRRPSVVDGQKFFTPVGEDAGQNSDFFISPLRRQASTSLGQQPLPTGTLSHADSYMSSNSRTADMAGMAVDEMGSSPSTTLLPLIQFSKSHEEKRRTAILVKVWLMVAGFYRRADMFDDSKAAIAEAQKLVQGLEYDVSKEGPGSAVLRTTGWAGKKCVDELWGDVWAEMGTLSMAKETPYVARAEFEAALTHFPDHPVAIVGLSNILLDIYAEKLLPPPAVPGLSLAGGATFSSSVSLSTVAAESAEQIASPDSSLLPSRPLGLYTSRSTNQKDTEPTPKKHNSSAKPQNNSELPPPYKAVTIPLMDRLAARERAFGLLSGLTKSGLAWNNSEAWFALARAHEESGQADKAKEVLWWCVELEEAAGVREWACVGSGGYVL